MIPKKKQDMIKTIKIVIGILLLPVLILLILVLSLLQKINSYLGDRENEMKKWHDDDYEGWLAFQIQMNRDRGHF